MPCEMRNLHNRMTRLTLKSVLSAPFFYQGSLKSLSEAVSNPHLRYEHDRCSRPPALHCSEQRKLAVSEYLRCPTVALLLSS